MSVARTLFKIQLYQTVSASTMSYANEATTGSTVKAALDWILASLYPNTQDSVDVPADLPAAGNTLNDYRVVLDDGDGKAAGYRWEQREGEATPSWHKIHDMDWSSDAILASLQDIAQELYVYRNGRTDLDASGNPVTGTYAGQTIYGGDSAGQNLTLNANSGDGTGAESGYVQSDNTLRPTSDNALDLGTLTERFRDLLLAGNLSDGTNSVSVAEAKAAFDHSQITDGSNPHATGYDSLSDKLGTVTVDGDATGSVDLSTSGDKTLTVTVVDDSHNHSSSTISDFAEATYDQVASLLQDGGGVTWTKDDSTNQITPTVTVDSGDISDIADPAANKILVGNPTGTDWVASDGTIELTGDVTGSATYDSTTDKWSLGSTVDNVGIDAQDWLDYQTILWTSTAGNPTVITCNGHGILTNERVRLSGFAALDGVHDATRVDPNSFSVPVDTTLAGDGAGWLLAESSQLLYDPDTDLFVAAKAQDQISHSELSDLGNDDHAQYVAIDGRASGQTIKGGVAASENLILESTNHGTKGTVQTKDTLTPNATAAYSGGWTGTDLGSSSKKWNDLYMAGEAKGLRAENLGSLPANSGTSIGRMVFFDGLPYWDNGSTWVSGGGGGGGVSQVTSQSSNYTAAVGDLVLCTGTFTVSLPDATSLDAGDQIVVKNISTGTISIDPFSSQTLDGSTLYDIVNQWESAVLVTDGSNWVRI